MVQQRKTLEEKEAELLAQLKQVRDLKKAKENEELASVLRAAKAIGIADFLKNLSKDQITKLKADDKILKFLVHRVEYVATEQVPT